MPAISTDFFGLSVLAPIETNYSGEPLVWPAWYPTAWRAIDNYGGVPPNYAYEEGISQWASVQLTTTYTIAASAATFTCPGATQLFSNGQTTQLYGSIPAGFTAGAVTYFIINVSALTFQLSATLGGSAVTTSTGSAGSCQIFDWRLMDLAWAKLIANGVNNVNFSFQAIPQWASVGNAYSFASSNVSAATPCVVTATGNQYANGWQVFFAPGGTLPTGLTAGTVYYVVHNGTDGTGKFRLSLTSGGADINTTGSAGTSTVTAKDSPPSSTTFITNWVTQYLTRATANRLPIKFVEGPNEPSDGVTLYVGTIAELVTIQNTIYTAAKAYDSTIQVLAPPVNGTTSGGTQAPGTPNGGLTYLQAFLVAGGGAYCDIIAFHGYPADSPTFSPVTYATNLAAFVAMLAANGQGLKPLWNTEFSSVSATASVDETYLARTMFIDLSYGVSRRYYYSYEGTGSSFLWINPTNSPPTGALNVAGIAYNQMVNWLSGLTLVAPLSTAGVVQSCDFAGVGGYHARAVWTSDGTTPSYTTPPWASQYRTLAGTAVVNPGASVTLGANPIFLEGTTVSSATRNIGWYAAA